MSRKAAPTDDAAPVAAPTPPVGVGGGQGAPETGAGTGDDAGADTGAGTADRGAAVDPADDLLAHLGAAGARRGEAGAFTDDLPGDFTGGVVVPVAGLPALARLLGLADGDIIAGRAYRDRVAAVTRDGRKLEWVPQWR